MFQELPDALFALVDDTVRKLYDRAGELALERLAAAAERSELPASGAEGEGVWRPLSADEKQGVSRGCEYKLDLATRITYVKVLA